MTGETEKKAGHDWQSSRIGHGEQQCANCRITNREAAALGETNGPCPKAPASPAPSPGTLPWKGEEIDAEAMRSIWIAAGGNVNEWDACDAWDWLHTDDKTSFAFAYKIAKASRAALAAPPVPWKGDREAIARIIDPGRRFAIRDWIIQHPDRAALNAARREASLPDENGLIGDLLAKADAILSLPQGPEPEASHD